MSRILASALVSYKNSIESSVIRNTSRDWNQPLTQMLTRRSFTSLHNDEICVDSPLYHAFTSLRHPTEAMKVSSRNCSVLVRYLDPLQLMKNA